jgi:hypothetical protein
MSIDADELAALREQTAEFIVADSKWITLIRPTRTPNGSGGYTETDVPFVFPQLFRLIPQHGNLSPIRTTLDGEAAQPDYVLLGEFDTVMARGDHFVDQGRRYVILFVHEKSSYEKKGEVKYLGEAT